MEQREAVVTQVVRRSLVLWIVLIVVEVIHGIVRSVFLVPIVGDLRARQIGVFIGAGLILGIAILSIRWLGTRSRSALFAIGGFWVVLTVVFEVAFGYAIGASTLRILSDYDLSRGGLMPIGLLIEFFSPYLAARSRGVLDHRSGW